MYTHVIRSKLGRVWVLGFAQQEGKRRDWHTWWCSLQDGREVEVRQERRIWQHSRTDEDTSRIGGRDAWAPSRLLLPWVFVTGEGPDEDLATQMRASWIRDADTDTDVDAGGRREPGAGSDGVASVLGDSGSAP